jgi:hypothetical protein
VYQIAVSGRGKIAPRSYGNAVVYGVMPAAPRGTIKHIEPAAESGENTDLARVF